MTCSLTTTIFWYIHHAKLIYIASELHVLPCVHVYGTNSKITRLHSHVWQPFACIVPK